MKADPVSENGGRAGLVVGEILIRLIAHINKNPINHVGGLGKLGVTPKNTLL